MNPGSDSLLTEPQCTSLLGGLLGTLMTMAEPDSVIKALHWWADNPAHIQSLIFAVVTNPVASAMDSAMIQRKGNA